MENGENPVLPYVKKKLAKKINKFPQTKIQACLRTHESQGQCKSNESTPGSYSFSDEPHFSLDWQLVHHAECWECSPNIPSGVFSW